MDLCASKFSPQPYRFDAFHNVLKALLDVVVLNDMRTLRYVDEATRNLMAVVEGCRAMIAARCGDRVRPIRKGHVNTPQAKNIRYLRGSATLH